MRNQTKVEANMRADRRGMAAKSLRAFARTYLAKHVSRPDSRLHRELYPLLQGMRPGGRLAIAAPRGSAKSTLISLIYVLWCICYQRQRYIVLLSDTGEKAEQFLSFVKDELTTNEKLRGDFPELWANPKGQRWRQNKIICGNGVKVSALGFGQNIRGRRHRESRPDLMILDDVESVDNTASPEARQKLSDWFDKSILKAGTQDTRVIVVGTIAHYDALLGRLTDPQKSPLWDGRIYRSINTWSNHRELWEQWTDILRSRADFAGAVGPLAATSFFEANREAMLEGTDVLWPEVEDYHKLMLMRETEGPASFDSEKQNHPINPDDCLFLEEEFQFWDDAYASVEELIAATEGHSLIIGACDPSLGRQGRYADDSAIITVLWDQKRGHIHILEADIRRRRPDEIIEAILNCQRRFNYNFFAFEINCFQSFLADELKRRSNEAGLLLPVEPIKNTTDKIGRIQSLQPLIRDGSIRFTRRQTQLLEQLRHFPKASHDDGPDALEMAVGLIRVIMNTPQSHTQIIPMTPAAAQMFSGRGFYDDYNYFDPYWSLDSYFA